MVQKRFSLAALTTYVESKIGDIRSAADPAQPEDLQFFEDLPVAMFLGLHLTNQTLTGTNLQNCYDHINPDCRQSLMALDPQYGQPPEGYDPAQDDLGVVDLESERSFQELKDKMRENGHVFWDDPLLPDGTTKQDPFKAAMVKGLRMMDGERQQPQFAGKSDDEVLEFAQDVLERMIAHRVKTYKMPDHNISEVISDFLSQYRQFVVSAAAVMRFPELPDAANEPT